MEILDAISFIFSFEKQHWIFNTINILIISALIMIILNYSFIIEVE